MYLHLLLHMVSIIREIRTYKALLTSKLGGAIQMSIVPAISGTYYAVILFTIHVIQQLGNREFCRGTFAQLRLRGLVEY